MAQGLRPSASDDSCPRCLGVPWCRAPNVDCDPGVRRRTGRSHGGLSHAPRPCARGPSVRRAVRESWARSKRSWPVRATSESWSPRKTPPCGVFIYTPQGEFTSRSSHAVTEATGLQRTSTMKPRATSFMPDTRASGRVSRRDDAYDGRRCGDEGDAGNAGRGSVLGVPQRCGGGGVRVDDDREKALSLDPCATAELGDTQP